MKPAGQNRRPTISREFDTMKHHITLTRLTAAAIIALFAAETLLFVDWIPDDAFISFRYARNIADGLGPVFNPGERVEGASNPLWT